MINRIYAFIRILSGITASKRDSQPHQPKHHKTRPMGVSEETEALWQHARHIPMDYPSLMDRL